MNCISLNDLILRIFYFFEISFSFTLDYDMINKILEINQFHLYIHHSISIFLNIFEKFNFLSFIFIK